MSAETLGYGHPCTSHVHKAWGELEPRLPTGRHSGCRPRYARLPSREEPDPEHGLKPPIASRASNTAPTTPKEPRTTPKSQNPKKLRPNVRDRVIIFAHGGPPLGWGVAAAVGCLGKLRPRLGSPPSCRRRADPTDGVEGRSSRRAESCSETYRGRLSLSVESRPGTSRGERRRSRSTRTVRPSIWSHRVRDRVGEPPSLVDVVSHAMRSTRSTCRGRACAGA